MNLKFGWISTPLNGSLKTIGQNITEYITIELLSRDIEVEFFYCEEDALAGNLNLYAKVGTLFRDEVYEKITSDTKNFNINNSDFVIFDDLYASIPMINWGLSHQDYFSNNTEKFESTFDDRSDVFDCCVCSAGGSTVNLILENVKLTHDAKIFVVDISKNSLDKCKERIGNNFEFVYLDLFDTSAVENFVKSIKATNGLWFASNIFNYVNTSLIYSSDIRRRKQQDFIKVLQDQKTNWYVSMNTADAELIKNKSVYDLKLIERNLNILPWVSCYPLN